MITHFVMMKFKDPADTARAVEGLLAMKGQIPDLLTLDVMTDELGRDGAYHLILRSTHADEEGLLGYLQHPVHVELGTWLRPLQESRAVIDARS